MGTFPVNFQKRGKSYKVPLHGPSGLMHTGSNADATPV